MHETLIVNILFLGNGSEIEKEKNEDFEEFDFSYEQTLPEENIMTMGYKYGFGNSSSRVFSVLQVSLQ